MTTKRHEDTHINTKICSIHNIPKLQMAQTIINSKMNKYILIYTYNGILCNKEENEPLIHVKIWINLIDIMVKRRRQRQKTTYLLRLSSVICKQIYDDKQQNTICLFVEWQHLQLGKGGLLSVHNVLILDLAVQVYCSCEN